MANHIKATINTYSDAVLRKPFVGRIGFNWKLGTVLLLLVCIPRFVLVLRANELASYGSIGIIMIISALIPYLFLNKHGQKQIGLTRPAGFKSLMLAFVSGVSISLLLYCLGDILYGDSYCNWYVYIGKSYQIPTSIDSATRDVMFVSFALIGATFSPIGEELFFRGLIHESFRSSLGELRASIVDSAAFAVVHVAHFGLVFINQEWTFLFVPAIIWTVSMFAVSQLFYFNKKKSSSLWGAILCHAGFNVGMMYAIFYLL